jgi:glycerophosphoryl diester phosphodiesterase
MRVSYPRIIAHRCGGALAPENSLAGLTAAARLGCRAVEFDVMLTADGVPILMHDETLERTTRCQGRVADLTFAAIRAGDPVVPTLAEAMAECRRLGLWTNIELKPSAGHDEATGEAVGAWLAAHWDGPGVISSFSEKSALAARRYLPTARFAMLYEALPADWQAQSVHLGATGVHLDAAAVDADVAAALNVAKLSWACYTVNTRAEADRLFALGAAAIFTDRPDLWAPDGR